MFPIMDGAQATIKLLGDLAIFVWLVLRPHGGLAAENLFLRKQLAMFQERKLKPRRPDAPFRTAPSHGESGTHRRDDRFLARRQPAGG